MPNLSVTPGGAIYVGGDLVVKTKNKDGIEYSMIFYPDKNNNDLRESGLPMHFYYIPDRVFLAKDTINGQRQYKFHLQKFAGVLTEDGNVATPQDLEIAGGYLVFSTTLAVDEATMAAIRDQLQAKLETTYKGSRGLLDWNRQLPLINISPVQITKAVTSIDKIDLGKMPEGGFGPPMGSFVVQGEGTGNISPTGTDAYSVMLGSLPVQLVEAASKSGESNLVVRKDLKFKIWTPTVHLKIKGNWESVFQHLSVAFKGRYWFASADVQAEFNNMQKSGVIEVDLSFDSEYLTADKQQQLEQNKQAIVDKFMEMAAKAIFEPAPPVVEPAKAEDKGNWLWNASGAFKFRKDRTTLSLAYDEKVQICIEKTTAVSANLRGLYDEIKADKSREKLYFSTIQLDEGFQKIHVISTAIANWGDATTVGDPIERIELEVGYPDSTGVIRWKSTGKYKDSATTPISERPAPAFWDINSQSRIYIFDFLKIKTLPKEQQNKIHVRKKIRYKERPNVLVNEVITQEIVEEKSVNVRGESAGRFNVNIAPDQTDLPRKMKMYVTCHVDGFPDKVYEFNAANTSGDNPANFDWTIFYKSPADIKPWKYKVDVSLAGPRILDKTLKWTSNWISNTDKGGDLRLGVSIPDVPEAMLPEVERYLGA